jgi:hypothetical protein
VVALDRRNGRPLWWYPTPEPDGAPPLMSYGFAAAVALDQAHVFAGGVDGRIHAFAR